MRRSLSLLLLALALHGSAEAKIFYSKEGAMKLAFPGADQVEPFHLFLTDDQAREIGRLAWAKVESKLVTVYVGKKQGRPLGLAVIDTHVVRTLPETFMVVLGLDGAVQAVHILAFHEPLEYLPPDGWLAQFRRRRLSSSLAVRYDIAGIAGSTLSAYAITAGVRKVLALFRVVIEPAMRKALATVVTTGRDPG